MVQNGAYKERKIILKNEQNINELWDTSSDLINIKFESLKEKRKKACWEKKNF